MKRIIVRRVLFLLIFIVLYFSIVGNFFVSDHNTDAVFKGFYLEPQNSIDVVLIGASSTYSSFNTLQAFHDYGFTSYDFCSGAQPISAAKHLIVEAKKTQNPKLFVVDIGQVVSLIGDPIYMRRVTTSMPHSINRLKTIIDMLQYNDDLGDVNFWDYYFKYLYFHNRWEEDEYWNEHHSFLGGIETVFCNESIEVDYVHHGFFNVWYENDYWKNTVADLDQLYVKESIPLPNKQEKALRELCEYCKTIETPVLFLCTPTVLELNYYREVNGAIDIINEYGFDVINSVNILEKIGIDNSLDWYDGGHLNYFGATKFTSFLSDYLAKEYSLPDHRRDIDYSLWEEEYQKLKNTELVQNTSLYRDLCFVAERNLDAIIIFNNAFLSWNEKEQLARMGFNEVESEEIWSCTVSDGKIKRKRCGSEALSSYLDKEEINSDMINNLINSSSAIGVIYGTDDRIVSTKTYNYNKMFECLSTIAEPYVAKVKNLNLEKMSEMWMQGSMLESIADQYDYIIDDFAYYCSDSKIHTECVMALSNTDCSHQKIYMELTNEQGQCYYVLMNQSERSDWADFMHRPLYSLGGGYLDISKDMLPHGGYTVKFYRENNGTVMYSGRYFEMVIE